MRAEDKYLQYNGDKEEVGNVTAAPRLYFTFQSGKVPKGLNPHTGKCRKELSQKTSH